MCLRTLIALWLGKLTQLILKPFPQFGGRAAPGLLALKIDPEFIKNLSSQIPTHILITGTNGKTTTARMIAQILKKEKINFIHNRTGSNLVRGIASTLINKSKVSGKIKAKIALWETDEAALLSLNKQIKPQILVLTNLFRDQLDRYGEIDTLAKKWQKVIKTLPKKSTLILNVDDPTLSSFAKLFKNSFCFGLSPKIKLKTKPEHASDASLCPFCLKPLIYKNVSYSHLGNFKPCFCGFSQSKKQIIAQNISQKNGKLKFNLKIKNQTHSLTLPLEGIFNVYNALAALAISQILNLSIEKTIQTLSGFTPAFGRSEIIKINNKILKLLLIKNPAGFNQVIDILVKNIHPPKFQASPPENLAGLTLLIAINDKIADGRDVSWLWDVNIEKLTPCIKKVIVSGTRAYDMALRIKYANNQQSTINNQQNIMIKPNLLEAVNFLLKEKSQNLYVLPTYTAMLKIREILRKKGLAISSWKD